MADRFEMRQTRRGVLAGLQPLIHGALVITGSSQMMGEELGLPRHEIGETLLQCRRDAGVQFLPFRAQQRRRISARWDIADRMQMTGEARLCEKLRKIEALFVEDSASARFRTRARGVWLSTEALAIELRCGGARRDGESGPTGR
jgi:hypothetical protein